MTTIDEMDEFVNWDRADASTSTGYTHNSALAGMPSMQSNVDTDNIDLVLSNVNEDDFSFCALQHFTDAQGTVDHMGTMNSMDAMDAMDTIDTVGTMNAMDSFDMPGMSYFWETPDTPCANCTLGGYACKKMREGRNSGYCTSCVALRVECSFGGLAIQSQNAGYMSIASGGPWPSSNNTLNNFNMNMSSTDDILGERLPPIGASPALKAMGMDDANNGDPKPKGPAKIGARFSRDSGRILKNWVSTHNRHPYPSDEEKEMLQRQTGLSKVQITNWLANARRRGKVQPPRSTSPHPGNWSVPIEIPQRRGTPALESMNPLQRWEHSPPEHEPASVTAIARAVTASSSAISSGLNSPFSFNFTDDGSSRSLCNQSSTSSLGTSHSSGGSRGSAYSHGSRHSWGSRQSWGSFGSAPFSNRQRRRRRRATPKNPNEGTPNLAMPLKTFQCTFCTETFRTKHDWQRHEKSLHLSLERWVCAPNGPRAANQDNGQMCCVFCGLADPDDAHIETHNHAACQERTLEERTFYRKDHLNQHLKLVHNGKFMDWSMKQWKVATPQIRSRCGFCGIVMDTWTIRVDHLAEHFKTGCSMADWKGDWGFDVPVLDMVENSIPPYLIHHERISPLPYVASQSPPESPRNAYGLIKLELAYFGANHWEQHQRAPTDEDMILEGCRIIFASELLSLQGIATQSSWLRDLIMNSDELSQKARFGPLRGAVESRLATLKINGKDNLFEQCPMEFQLQEFARGKILLGLTAMDDELQEEACRIVGRVEETCTHPSEPVANWLLRLITSSTGWLAAFRRRARLPRSEDVQDHIVRSTDPKSIDSTIHSYSRLERELGDFVKSQRSVGVEPTDEDLQREARIIIYEFDDGWNQTAADNLHWLNAFKRRHPLDGVTPGSSGTDTASPEKSNAASKFPNVPLQPYLGESSSKDDVVPAGHNDFQGLLNNTDNQERAIPFFLNDANCYRRLARELRRWVATVTSPKNPNRHMPSDDELQYQARWILYDDDDPWNQTAADNAEWLQRFKRDAGLAKEPGPGLPDGYAWALEQGGSGFAPPYAYPNGHLAPFSDNVPVAMRTGAKAIMAHQSAANSFLENLLSQTCRPPTVFCSRELEYGLVELVQDHVAVSNCLPSDEVIQKRAKEIVNADETAADDPVLLEKFKDWMRGKMPGLSTGPQSEVDIGDSVLPTGMDVGISDEELGNILQDMDFDLVPDAGTLFQEQTEDGGGVSLTGTGFND